MKPRLAVLDMIGTTVQAGPEVSDSFREAFAKRGVDLSTEDVDRVRGRSKREAIAELVKARWGERTSASAAEEIYTDFESILRSRYETASRPVAGAREAIEALARLGVAVVLTTGLDRDTAKAIIEGIGWGSLDLAGLITGDDVSAGRPAPDLIHAAMALAGVEDPGAVLVAGDTVSDLEAADRAGVAWSVGVLSGAHTRAQLEGRPHSIILDSIAHLTDWLGRRTDVERETARGSGENADASGGTAR